MKKSLCLLLSVVLIIMSFATFSTTSADNIIFGDVNSDGEVTALDLVLLRRWLVHDGTVSNKDIDRKAADVSGWPEGEITVSDANRLAKYLAKIYDTLTPKGYTTIAADAHDYTIKQMNSCMTLCGRAEFGENNESVVLSQTASGFKFTANCHGNIVINCLKVDKNCKFSVAVDGDYDNQVLADAKAEGFGAYAETNMTEGTHTIEIRKATEWSQCGKITVTGVTISGTLGTTAPEQKAHRIEFYGDSITSGYGNLTTTETSPAGSWLYQDGTRSYAAFTAHHYDAEYAIATASGHGILGGYVGTTSTYDKYFKYSCVPDKTPWSVADYDADLIVINLGSNDHFRCANAGTQIDQSAFVAKCSGIVEDMHTQNPDAKILWVVGMMGVDDSRGLISALTTLDNKYDYVDFQKMTAKANGGDWHPTIDDHKYHANNLCNIIDQKYPNMFN